jgi:DNA-binding GntR family transcriptional regulator
VVNCLQKRLGELLGIKRMTLRQALLSLEAESRIFRKDRDGLSPSRVLTIA